MTAVDLLRELRRKKIAVVAQRDELAITAPKGVLSDALRAQLIAHKSELLDLLRAPLAEQPRIAPLERGSHEPIEFVASFAQQRLWLLQQLAPENSFCNVPISWRLIGRLDVQALQQTLDALVARHETLRTTFRAEDKSVLQVTGQPQPVKLAIVDLSELPERDREAEARQLAEQEGLRPFDLSTGPLIRAQLLRLSSEDHVLQLTLHHIISYRTAGRSRFWLETWVCCTKPIVQVARPRYPRFPFSTRTSRFGSGSGSRAACSRSSSITGDRGSRVYPSCSCRRIGRAPRCPVMRGLARH